MRCTNGERRRWSTKKKMLPLFAVALRRSESCRCRRSSLLPACATVNHPSIKRRQQPSRHISSGTQFATSTPVYIASVFINKAKQDGAHQEDLRGLQGAGQGMFPSVFRLSSKLPLHLRIIAGHVCAATSQAILPRKSSENGTEEADKMQLNRPPSLPM